MEQSLEEKLLYAIKRDDAKAFGALMSESNVGGCRLGRFPVLSLMYLFGARRLLKTYEAAFLKISSWEALSEPASVSALFAKRAGKCLRLYFDEIVSPTEMLLILDKTARLKKAYPVARPSEAIRKRLKAIYSIKYALNVSFRGNDIVLDRRPLTRSERRRLALAAVSCLLIIAIVIAVPVTTTSLLPNRAAGEVTKLKHIDFSSRSTYTLLKDVVIPEDFSVGEVNCSIRGGGGRLIFEKGATLGTFNGKLSDLEVVTAGSPMFEVCTNLAEIKDVTINVAADVRTNSDGAFVTLTNYGVIDGVTLNVSGKVSAFSTASEDDTEETETVEELAFGGVAARNTYALTPSNQPQYGEIRNVQVNFSNFELEGVLLTNAAFGGIVGVNNANVTNCSVKGDIIADTFDAAGACYANGYILSHVLCDVNISQISHDEKWTPTIGGVVIENAGMTEYCASYGQLSAQGEGNAVVGGIAAKTYRFTDNCYAAGKISVVAKTAYAGGIFGYSMIVESGGYVYFGVADRCVSETEIHVELSADGASCVGGIGGRVDDKGYEQYERDEFGRVIVDENGNRVTTIVYWGGGVTNSAFLGKIESNFDMCGSIVGACGENIFAANSYFADGEELHNFEGNLYLTGGAPAIGATMKNSQAETPELSPATDKGATPASRSDIENSAIYRDLMSSLA